MEKKSLEFMIKVGAAAGVAIVGGAAGAYLTDIITHSHELIALNSSIAGLVSETLTYAVIHYYQEKKNYLKNEKFDYSTYIKDVGKAFLGLRGLDLVNYIVLRPILNYSFQTYLDATPIVASVLSDTVHLAYHAVSAVPMGKLMGLIKKDRSSQ